MNTIILFYVPVANKTEAHKISTKLLEKKLVTCVNIIPAESSFIFEQKIQQKNECIMILKTLPTLQTETQKVIESLHSYSMPCVLAIQTTASPEYVAWMQNELA